MALHIQTSNDFIPSAVRFSAIKKNKNGGRTVYLNSAAGNKLLIQLPFMRSPFGVSTYIDEATNRTSYSLDLSFDADNEDAVKLQKKLSDLDELIVNTVATNSKEWLGKPYNVAVLKEALYKPLIRGGKEQYASTLKLKVLKKDNGDFVPEAYDTARKQISVDTIEKGQKVLCIVDLSSIWFIDNKFGVSVRLQQVLVEQSTKLPSFAFVGLAAENNEVDDE